MVPLQDILNLPAAARMNTLGIPEGMWRWRCTHEMLASPAIASLGDLTRATKREQNNTPHARHEQMIEPLKKGVAHGITTD